MISYLLFGKTDKRVCQFYHKKNIGIVNITERHFLAAIIHFMSLVLPIPLDNIRKPKVIDTNQSHEMG